MVGEGIAEWVTDGKRTLHTAVCLIGGMARRTPRVATIDDKHILRAYVAGSRDEQTRIIEYGQLSRGLIQNLVRHVPAHLFDEMKKKYLDVPVLEDTNNDGDFAPEESEEVLYGRYRNLIGSTS